MAMLLCLATLRLTAQAPSSILTPKAAPAQPEMASPTPTPAPTPVQAIPLPEIANQAEQLDARLREIQKNIQPSAEIRVSDPEAKAHAEEIRQRAQQAEDFFTGIPNMMQLQDEERYWRALAEEYGSQRKLLTTRAASIEKDMQVLEFERARWLATSEQVRQTSGLQEVANRVERELDAIEKLHAGAKEQLNQILTLQNRISEQDREVSSVLLKLTEARQRVRGRLLERDSFPLWTARELRFRDQSMSVVIYQSAGRGFTGAPTFLHANRIQLLASAALYIFMLVTAFYVRRYVADREKPGITAEAARVFARPYSVALLITLLMTIGITAKAPTGISLFVCLLYIVPVLRLLPIFTDSAMRSVLHVLCAFYFLQWMHLVLQFGATFKRELFALIILIAFVAFAWLTRSSRLEAPTPRWRHKLLIAGLRAGLLLLMVSLCANILGFVSLSRIVGVGTLFSSFLLALLYTLVKVVELGLKIALGGNWFQSLPDGRAQVVERWGLRILVICATLLWLDINLYLFTVRDTVMEALAGVLQHPIGFGKVRVTLGGTMSVLLLLLLGYIVANIAKFLLEEVLLPKLSLRGGVTYAISRVTYYILLVGLFFAALSDAGIELNKFTVITGALGLGVGFGLQNIVNNFASGVIILFERPFRVGDTVEVAGVTGLVRRIGARSSTVLTFQGAEVILPNSSLLSNQVINWTLSSPRRRVEVPVGVSYGADPMLVQKLLLEVAHSSTRILSYPAPEAFFLGFGESALNFELRFWAAQSVWFELKSEIGLAVFRALREAGIEIPYPQRDLHLRGFDAAAGKELTTLSDGEQLKKMAAGR